jgi:phosphoserine phosphatase
LGYFPKFTYRTFLLQLPPFGYSTDRERGMQRWTSSELVFFDCDSTLSTIEGIDELARLKGKEMRVGLLTQKAMDGDLDLAEVYGKRLRAINPTRTQLEAIKSLYAEHMVEDSDRVVSALMELQKSVFIISGGLLDAVRGFGEHLGVQPDHIRAVELEYNELSGEWWRYYDERVDGQQKYLTYNEGPLTVTTGKPEIVQQLAGGIWGRRVLVGDGVSDLATRNNGVDLFVGFGGVVVRPKVEVESDVFIYSESLAPMLPLAAGRVGWEQVQGSMYEAVFRKGLDIAFSNGQLRFRDETLRASFMQEFADA